MIIPVLWLHAMSSVQLRPYPNTSIIDCKYQNLYSCFSDRSDAASQTNRMVGWQCSTTYELNIWFSYVEIVEFVLLRTPSALWIGSLLLVIDRTVPFLLLLLGSPGTKIDIAKSLLRVGSVGWHWIGVNQINKPQTKLLPFPRQIPTPSQYAPWPSHFLDGSHSRSSPVCWWGLPQILEGFAGGPQVNNFYNSVSHCRTLTSKLDYNRRAHRPSLSLLQY